MRGDVTDSGMASRSAPRRPHATSIVLLAVLLGMGPACGGSGGDPGGDDPGDPAGVLGELGEIIPSATEAQRALFEEGREVGLRRFDLGEGLGPTFNVTFCLGCHERPVPGGSSGLYRNFFLSGFRGPNGTFVTGDKGGVIRVYDHPTHPGFVAVRPPIAPEIEVVTQRNAIPLFGVGLLARIPDEEIRRREDPFDDDGDGISGLSNVTADGSLGRFGRKAQTASIEGFARGPLANHMGITTDPLPFDLRNALPFPSPESGLSDLRTPQQAPADDDAPTVDSDPLSDPELSDDDLFALVSFVGLLAGPEPEELDASGLRGRSRFEEIGCAACHTPVLEGPDGPLPVHSDLLLHDLGPDLADGIEQGFASGSDFRTQPLWGIAAVGPYLHDGRAETIDEAIGWHGGEASVARDGYLALSTDDRADLVEYLLSLGGRSQRSSGLLPLNAPIPGTGAYGGPLRPLTADEGARFTRGREVFDRDFGHASGVGALAGVDGVPRFNGDSCRGCHFDPVLGGAGPRGVNVMRHGYADGTAPTTTPNTILHKEIRAGVDGAPPEAEAGVDVFEHRQTPHVFGAGLIDAISEATIRGGADPSDVDGDGIRGRAHVLADGRIGRFGWKADVPSVAEFVRDAMAAEIGITLPARPGLTFGLTADEDGIPDPELTDEEVDDLLFFLSTLAGPPRAEASDPEAAARGEVRFADLGCNRCHTPSLPGALGDVPLYSDLLLHEILPPGATGITSGSAGVREFRTAPLWGLSSTAPYLHDGGADTIDQAIRAHDGEAREIREAYEALPEADRADLRSFLDTL